MMGLRSIGLDTKFGSIFTNQSDILIQEKIWEFLVIFIIFFLMRREKRDRWEENFKVESLKSLKSRDDREECFN